ncbi:MAG: 2-hydroxyacyl-CoA dehydratase family protein [Proteobacteria bacterium]|nr:2-hydroxyacyl-CoA dehydratase family protein [Pseudomonadota bacterium]
MSNSTGKRIGYACAYTPLALIDAAGFVPVRVLPEGDFPDQAGHLMHDNLCPHVKKILDRALANDLDHIDGMIFVNCCDAMRRLSDAWQVVYPNNQSILLDLPVNISPLSISFFAQDQGFSAFLKAAKEMMSFCRWPRGFFPKRLVPGCWIRTIPLKWRKAFFQEQRACR